MQGKMNPGRSAGEKQTVGIDVCKEWLDVYAHPGGFSMRAQNTAAGVRRLARALAGMEVALIVTEATNKHHRLAQRHLAAQGHAVAVVNPLFVRLFAQSTGQFAKTDRLDARGLALYGEAAAPKAHPPQPEAVEELQELLSARAAAVEEATALKNRRGDSRTGFLRAELARRITQTERHVARIEAMMMTRIEASPELRRRYEILITIPGIGKIAALSLVVGLPELGACTGRGASLMVGLAPLADDSGKHQGARHIRGGRAIVRQGIYFAAVSAATRNGPLAAVYRRLVDTGKPKKVALVALMRKLVVLANTLIRDNRTWTPVKP